MNEKLWAQIVKEDFDGNLILSWKIDGQENIDDLVNIIAH